MWSPVTSYAPATPSESAWTLPEPVVPSPQLIVAVKLPRLVGGLIVSPEASSKWKSAIGITESSSDWGSSNARGPVNVWWASEVWESPRDWWSIPKKGMPSAWRSMTVKQTLSLPNSDPYVTVQVMVAAPNSSPSTNTDVGTRLLFARS